MRSFKKTLLATVTVVMASAGAAQATPNLLTNGSFENGFSSWTIAGAGTTPGIGPVIFTTDGVTPGHYGEIISPDNVSQSPDPVGTHGVYFVDDNALETLSQSVNVVAGQAYEVGFDYYVTMTGDANVNPFTLSVDLGGSPFTLDTAEDPFIVGQWEHVSGDFTAALTGPDLFTFTFASGATPAKDVVIDSVYAKTATDVPEPITLSLFGAGLAGAAVMRRRRKANQA